jgi:hypothetical protein
VSAAQTPSGGVAGEGTSPLGHAWQLPLCEAEHDYLRCDKLDGHLGAHHDMTYGVKWEG